MRIDVDRRLGAVEEGWRETILPEGVVPLIKHVASAMRLESNLLFERVQIVPRFDGGPSLHELGKTRTMSKQRGEALW